MDTGSCLVLGKVVAGQPQRNYHTLLSDSWISSLSTFSRQHEFGLAGLVDWNGVDELRSGVIRGACLFRLNNLDSESSLKQRDRHTHGYEMLVFCAMLFRLSKQYWSYTK